MADIDELKATDERVVVTFNRRDLPAFITDYHDQFVFFAPDAPFAVEGKEAFRQAMQTFFGDHESLTFTPINPQYRVLGTTGVVWGHYALALKPKDGPARTEFGRYTDTYVKVGGKWLVVATHISRIPSAT